VSGGLGTHRAAAWLAWALAGLCLAGFAATVVLYVAIRPVMPPSAYGTGADSTVVIFVVPFLAFPLVGALIASRRPRNPIGWICLSAGASWMLATVTGPYAWYGTVANPGSLPFPAAIGSLTAWMWTPALGLLGTFLVLLFPDGRLPSRRWRPLAWTSGAVIVLGSAGTALKPGRPPDLGGAPNPFGLEEHAWVAVAMETTLALLPLCFLASALGLVLRFRRSVGEEREQIKWMAFAGAVVGVGFFCVIAASVLVPPPVAGGARPLWQTLLEDAVALSFAGVPVAVGVAVLRYRLYDIDVIINRTLVYGLLTATLVAAYLSGIVVVQRLFVVLAGEESTLAVVASTLAVAALFSPVRRRLQGFVDRRFYRRKYDAARTLEDFSSRLREETRLDNLLEEVARVVNESVQPTHVSVWLRSGEGHRGS
jgi:hypothetical protein